jgi:hypothetical protein
MAHQLESLTEHFEKMEVALRDSEAGEMFSEDDIQGTHRHGLIACTSCSSVCQEMMRDAEELPVILAELEDAWTVVERSQYDNACPLMVLFSSDQSLKRRAAVG